MLFLHNTSRVEDEPYPTLLRDKGFNGFPSLCYMDADGQVIGTPQGPDGSTFSAGLLKAEQFVQLKAKAASGDPKLQRELLVAEIELGLIRDAAALDRRLAEVKDLSAPQQQMVAQFRSDLEVRDIFAQRRELGATKVAERLAAMAAAGRIPTSTLASPFWSQVLTHAKNTKDGALADTAFAVLQQHHANDLRMQPRLDAWKAMVEEAKAK